MAWMCSADSHVIEPGDVWTSRVPASMKDRAPRIERVGDDFCMYVEGQMAGSLPVKTFALEDGNTLPPDDVPGRLELIENDGIWAEALIGNLAGGFVFGMEEPEFAFACAPRVQRLARRDLRPLRRSTDRHRVRPALR